MHRFQLIFELRESVADLAAIEVQGAFAGARTLLPAAAGRGLPHTGGDVFQPRHLHLEFGLAGVGVAVENLNDDAGAIQHLGAGGALEIADLAGRELVVNDNKRGFACSVRVGFDRVDRLGGAFEPLPGL